MDGVGQAILDRLALGPASYTQLCELGIHLATIARTLARLEQSNSVRRAGALWELIPMATVCISCGTELTEANWYPSSRRTNYRKCKTCHTKGVPARTKIATADGPAATATASTAGGGPGDAPPKRRRRVTRARTAKPAAARGNSGIQRDLRHALRSLREKRRMVEAERARLDGSIEAIEGALRAL